MNTFTDKLDLLVLAAGTGTRMGNDRPKQFLDLCGKPIIIHTLSVFEKLEYIGKKYITSHPAYINETEGILSQYGITQYEIIPGGETRAASVRNGLERIQTERVITQNAVLPFVNKELVDNVVAEYYDCTTTVTPLQYNVCKGKDFAEQIIERDELKLINSPQTFKTQIFRECHEKASHEIYVPKSDCELMLHYGYTVRFVQGNETNFKITTPMDLAIAEYILRNRLSI